MVRGRAVVLLKGPDWMGRFGLAVDCWIGVMLVVYLDDASFLLVYRSSCLDLLGLGMSGLDVGFLGLCTEQSLESLCEGTALCEIFLLWYPDYRSPFPTVFIERILASDVIEILSMSGYRKGSVK